MRKIMLVGMLALLAAPALAKGGGGGDGGGGAEGSGSGGDPAGVFAVHKSLSIAHGEPPRRPPPSRARQMEQYSCDGGIDFPARNTIGGCRAYGSGVSGHGR